VRDTVTVGVPVAVCVVVGGGVTVDDSVTVGRVTDRELVGGGVTVPDKERLGWVMLRDAVGGGVTVTDGDILGFDTLRDIVGGGVIVVDKEVEVEMETECVRDPLAQEMELAADIDSVPPDTLAGAELVTDADDARDMLTVPLTRLSLAIRSALYGKNQISSPTNAAPMNLLAIAAVTPTAARQSTS